MDVFMLLCALLLISDAESVYRKAEKAIFTVETSDSVGTGFAIKDGKFLITCDHVVGTESKITVKATNGSNKIGYLVFHDKEADVAVYRLNVRSTSSLKLNTNTINPGSKVYVIGSSLGFLEKSISQGIVAGIRRQGDLALVQFDAAISAGNSGSPILNENGEVLGMAQMHLVRGQSLNFGLSAYNLDRFLNSKNEGEKGGSAPEYVGKALKTTRIFAEPNADSRVFFTASSNQYLYVSKYDNKFHKVRMSDGVFGYVDASEVQMSQVVRPPSLGPATANGKEVLRCIESYDQSKIRETSNLSLWMAECAEFVRSVFSACGREISADVEIQLDIGSRVARLEHLLAGDRLYFATGQYKRAAIYDGEKSFYSVTKSGKLIKNTLDEEAVRQLVEARR
jgi:hypothetical protein